MSEETVEAVVEILEKLGLDFAMFEDDTCCGFPLYELGQIDAAKEVAAITLERIQVQNPEVLLTTCPACFKSFKFLLPDEMDLETGFDVQHISEFLRPWWRAGCRRCPNRSPGTIPACWVATWTCTKSREICSRQSQGWTWSRCLPIVSTPNVVEPVAACTFTCQSHGQ